MAHKERPFHSLSLSHLIAIILPTLAFVGEIHKDQPICADEIERPDGSIVLCIKQEEIQIFDLRDGTELIVPGNYFKIDNNGKFIFWITQNDRSETVHDYDIQKRQKEEVSTHGQTADTEHGLLSGN